MKLHQLLCAPPLAFALSSCATSPSPAPPRDMQALFRKADRDGNGKVSREEFSAFIIEEAFYNYDKNGNGRVALAEYVAGGGTSEGFRKIARPGNDYFTLEDALASPAVIKVVSIPFDEADTNRNGSISWAEYLAARERAQAYTR